MNAWKQNIERAGKIFSGRSTADLQQEVAPGKNRLIYLWGHLTAVHDAMLPLLGLGPRLLPNWTFLSSLNQTNRFPTYPQPRQLGKPGKK
jgi:hypothetical protein